MYFKYPTHILKKTTFEDFLQIKNINCNIFRENSTIQIVNV